MKKWQKVFITFLAILTIGVIAFGLYLVIRTETLSPKINLSTNVNNNSPTQRPTEITLATCEKPIVSAWLEKLEERQNEHNNDLDTILTMQSSNLDHYINLAYRAESRYIAQRYEQTPECLRNLQTLMTDIYYYHWQGLDSVTKGNWDEGANYLQIAAEKLVAADTAIDGAIELARKNDESIDESQLEYVE